jgi:hypothetical protein
MEYANRVFMLGIADHWRTLAEDHTSVPLTACRRKGDDGQRDQLKVASSLTKS